MAKVDSMGFVVRSSGEVRVRSAQTVLPVAVGDAEAEWVEQARANP